MSEFQFKDFEQTELLTISPCGRVRINWSKVEEHASEWQAGCTDVHIGYCLALMAVRDKTEVLN